MTQPASYSLSECIQAASSGNRDALLQLVGVIVMAAKSALACLCQHFKAHPRALTLDNLSRIKHCAVRLQAIFHTLAHAPERFFTPAQLRALPRAQAVLARLWRQPVDFSPLVPLMTSPESCPPPPSTNSLGARAATPASDLCPSASSSSLRDAPQTQGTSNSSPADPLLLRSPGCALASVLLHIAALYGISNHRAPAPQPALSPSAPSAPAPVDAPSIVSTCKPNSSLPSDQAHSPFETEFPIPNSPSPHSAFHAPP